jgi:hypothetical protein
VRTGSQPFAPIGGFCSALQCFYLAKVGEQSSPQQDDNNRTDAADNAGRYRSHHASQHAHNRRDMTAACGDWSCGLREFLVLAKVIHINLTVGLHPVFGSFDGERSHKA